jgi:U5 small nuclear ribonucleoprotein component
MATISDTWIANSRYIIPTSGVPAGNWVLLGGVDNSIVKTATLVPPRLEDDEDAHLQTNQTLYRIRFQGRRRTHQPIRAAQDARRPPKGQQSYPLITTKVEESGEHVILGTGELYMDCVLHDLRRSTLKWN